MAHSKWKCDILLFVRNIFGVLHCTARCCFAICYGLARNNEDVANQGMGCAWWHSDQDLAQILFSWIEKQFFLGLLAKYDSYKSNKVECTEGHCWCFKHLCFGKNRQFICPTCSSYHSLSKPHPSSKYKEHDWSKWLHATGQANATKGRQKHKGVSRSGGSVMSQMPMWGGRLGFNRRPH